MFRLAGVRRNLRTYTQSEKYARPALILCTTQLATSAKEAQKPDLLLAKPWNESIDPTGYHLSEKYDGIRAFWDHKKKKLVSRLGNRIHAPSWFTKDLPNRMSLDGELWSGRNKFHQAVSIIRTSLDSEVAARRKSKPNPDDDVTETSWKNISYRVFDTPSHGDLPFEERLECLQKWISRVPPTEESPKLVSHRLCKSQDDLITTLDEVERDGGEGLMLRAPGSLYEAGRSSTLLKVKRTSEEECMVVAYTAGVGRNEGRVGSLVCLMRNGKLLRLGSGLTDEARENPPKIGSIVTCRYMGVTRDNIPRFATLRGERIDWDPSAEQVMESLIPPRLRSSYSRALEDDNKSSSSPLESVAREERVDVGEHPAGDIPVTRAAIKLRNKEGAKSSSETPSGTVASADVVKGEQHPVDDNISENTSTARTEQKKDTKTYPELGSLYKCPECTESFSGRRQLDHHLTIHDLPKDRHKEILVQAHRERLLKGAWFLCPEAGCNDKCETLDSLATHAFDYHGKYKSEDLKEYLASAKRASLEYTATVAGPVRPTTKKLRDRSAIVKETSVGSGAVDAPQTQLPKQPKSKSRAFGSRAIPGASPDTHKSASPSLATNTITAQSPSSDDVARTVYTHPTTQPGLKPETKSIVIAPQTSRPGLKPKTITRDATRTSQLSPYQCRACSKSFWEPGHLRRHVASMHRNLAEAEKLEMLANMQRSRQEHFKKISCVIDGCHGSSNILNNYRAHLRECHGIIDANEISERVTEAKQNWRDDPFLAADTRTSTSPQTSGLAPYQCRACSESFWSPDSLRNHVASAHGNLPESEKLEMLANILRFRQEHFKKISCVIDGCHKSFNNIEKFRRHLRTCHGIIDANEISERVTEAMQNWRDDPFLVADTSTSTSPQTSELAPYQCRACSESFWRPLGLRRHVASAHGDLPEAEKLEMLANILQYRQERFKMISCVVDGCHKSFNDIDYFKRHLRTCHGIMDSSEMSERMAEAMQKWRDDPFSAADTSTSTSPQTSELAPYQCRACSESFWRVLGLRRHVASAHGNLPEAEKLEMLANILQYRQERFKKISCVVDGCHGSNNDIGNFKVHLRTCHGIIDASEISERATEAMQNWRDDPFLAADTSTSTSTPTYRVHSTRKSNQTSQLGPYQCRACSESFWRPFSLRRHVASAHGNLAEAEKSEMLANILQYRQERLKKISCVVDGCHKSFNNIEKFRRHLRTCHGIIDENEISERATEAMQNWRDDPFSATDTTASQPSHRRYPKTTAQLRPKPHRDQTSQLAPYRCFAESCSKSYWTLSELRAHVTSVHVDLAKAEVSGLLANSLHVRHVRFKKINCIVADCHKSFNDITILRAHLSCHGMVDAIEVSKIVAQAQQRWRDDPLVPTSDPVQPVQTAANA